MNVDFNRSSPHTRILDDFIEDFNLYTCTGLPNANVQYTYINPNDVTSKIDHFFVTESVRSLTLECSIIDNDLYSDHVPLYLKFHIDVLHVPEQKQPFTAKQAWHKASEQDVNLYKDRLDDLLSIIQVDDEMLHCRDVNCTHHKDLISELYNSVISSCITASDHIPTTTRGTKKIKPGWNDSVKELKNEALSWHVLWKNNGFPREGYLAEQRKISRARYHRAIRHIERNTNRIRMEKMADDLLSNSSADVYRAVDQMKPRSSMVSSTVDGNNDCESITNMFSDKYNMLYNSVPYDKDETKCIETEIMSRIERQSNDCYCTTVHDVINAVAHLKVGKSEGSDGLFSDHFIDGNKLLHVFSFLLFTCFLVHGFSPDSMTLGTMIPIPKDKKKSLCNSSE